VKRSILLAGIAAAALSFSPVAYAQTSPTVTNPTSPATSNPKSDLNNAQCTTPQPGEAHMNMAKCPKPMTAPIPTKTLPKTKPDRKTATPANATQTTTTPSRPATTNPAQACEKSNAPTSTPTTPSPPQCDSHSGAHEGGPFGH
jgi:hypothetical protein